MSWLTIDPDHPFGIDSLAYGAITIKGGSGPSSPAVRIGDAVLPLHQVCGKLSPEHAQLFDCPNLDRLLAAGPDSWRAIRLAVTDWLTDERHRDIVEPALIDLAAVEVVLPFTVADYVDFYASENHASNVGRIFRKGAALLPPNWKNLTIGYHGRAGTVVVSGTPVVRPCGQRPAEPATDPVETEFAPTDRLDLEAEVGFVVGVGSELGRAVPLADFDQHVFGVVLLNDWSARDIQFWEYVPLGPFLGKSFATSISGWVTPLSALTHARVPPVPQDPAPLPYLSGSGVPGDDAARPDSPGSWNLDLRLEVHLNGQLISQPPFAGMYWTAAQMLAHLTVNGASLRTGDLYGSGTVSGPHPDELGCLLELTWNGATPLSLPDGTTRRFLHDGDEVVLTATAPGPGGSRIGLGEVRGVVAPARVSNQSPPP